MRRVIAHVDMDCFFCSCEEKADPSLKGKPVMVGATGSRGVVSAANYEARKYGVFSATPISIARARCPDGIFLGGTWQLYRRESRVVMAILARCATEMRQVSVDEAYLDVTEFSKKFASWQEMGEHIREQIREETQLSCSVGIAHSKTVAKIASDHKKPGGVTAVEDPKAFLHNLPIETFPGIGKKSKEWYRRKGVSKIGDLTALTKFQILDRFGLYGIKFQNIALGKDFSKLHPRRKAKSIGHERTFREDTLDRRQVKEQLARLTQKVIDELDGRYCKKVSLKARFTGFITLTRDITLPTPTNEFTEIYAAVEQLFNEVEEKPIRLIGVRVSRLSVDCGSQQTLAQFLTPQPLGQSV